MFFKYFYRIIFVLNFFTTAVVAMDNVVKLDVPIDLFENRYTHYDPQNNILGMSYNAASHVGLTLHDIHVNGGAFGKACVDQVHLDNQDGLLILADENRPGLVWEPRKPHRGPSGSSAAGSVDHVPRLDGNLVVIKYGDVTKNIKLSGHFIRIALVATDNKQAAVDAISLKENLSYQLALHFQKRFGHNASTVHHENLVGLEAQFKNEINGKTDVVRSTRQGGGRVISYHAQKNDTIASSLVSADICQPGLLKGKFPRCAIILEGTWQEQARCMSDLFAIKEQEALGVKEEASQQFAAKENEKREQEEQARRYREQYAQGRSMLLNKVDDELFTSNWPAYADSQDYADNNLVLVDAEPFSLAANYPDGSAAEFVAQDFNFSARKKNEQISTVIGVFKIEITRLGPTCNFKLVITEPDGSRHEYAETFFRLANLNSSIKQHVNDLVSENYARDFASFKVDFKDALDKNDRAAAQACLNNFKARYQLDDVKLFVFQFQIDMVDDKSAQHNQYPQTGGSTDVNNSDDAHKFNYIYANNKLMSEQVIVFAAINDEPDVDGQKAFDQSVINAQLVIDEIAQFSLAELKEIYGPDFSDEQRASLIVFAQECVVTHQRFSGNFAAYKSYVKFAEAMSTLNVLRIDPKKPLKHDNWTSDSWEGVLNQGLLHKQQSDAHNFAREVLASGHCVDADVISQLKTLMTENYVDMAKHPLMRTSTKMLMYWLNEYARYDGKNNFRYRVARGAGQGLMIIDRINPEILPQLVTCAIGCYRGGFERDASINALCETLTPSMMKASRGGKPKSNLKRAQQRLQTCQAGLVCAQAANYALSYAAPEMATTIDKKVLRPAQDVVNFGTNSVNLVRAGSKLHKYWRAGTLAQKGTKLCSHLSNIVPLAFSINDFMRRPLELPKNSDEWSIADSFWHRAKQCLPDWNGSLCEDATLCMSTDLAGVGACGLGAILCGPNPVSACMFAYANFQFLKNMAFGAHMDEALLNTMINIGYHQSLLQDKNNQLSDEKIAEIKAKIAASYVNLQDNTNDSPAILSWDSIVRKQARVMRMEHELEQLIYGKAWEQFAEMSAIDFSTMKFKILDLDVYEGLSMFLSFHNHYISQKLHDAVPELHESWVGHAKKRAKLGEYLLNAIDRNTPPENAEKRAAFFERQGKLKNTIEAIINFAN